MKLKAILFFTAAIIAIGCGGAPEPNTNANAASIVNANAAKSNSSSLTTTTPTPVSTTNDAPTLKPVFKAYCAAYVRKDEAAVRRAYTADSIAFFEREMKEDRSIKSVLDYLADDGISNEVCDVKNEFISGDTATAEITTKAYLGVRVVFEKENGEWKLTNKRPEGSLK